MPEPSTRTEPRDARPRRPASSGLGFLNSEIVNLPVAEDYVVIFPSKTYHATEPNDTDGPRVSISVDVVVALKDSAGVEFVMPPVRHWRSSGDF